MIQGFRGSGEGGRVLEARKVAGEGEAEFRSEYSGVSRIRRSVPRAVGEAEAIALLIKHTSPFCEWTKKPSVQSGS